MASLTLEQLSADAANISDIYAAEHGIATATGRC